MNIRDFHYYIGETLMYCQRIEHDIKLIYAGMLNGDFNKNYKKVNNKSLGIVLKDLEELDKSDNKPFFSDKDYDTLDEIRDIRNYIVHKTYREFMYSENHYNEYMAKEYKQLIEDHNRLADLSNQTERIRLDIMQKYGRI